MDENTRTNASPIPGDLNEIELAEQAFTKLPLLGPVTWLFGRTPRLQTLTLKDLDWAVVPPTVLDQCRIFFRGKLPFGFITWAYVSDAVNARLMQGNTRLEPHEWKGGSHRWLIDVVTPFGGRQTMLNELRADAFPSQSLRYVNFNTTTGLPEVLDFDGIPVADTHPKP